jgi:uncharacterized iron-regulated membrane protein
MNQYFKCAVKIATETDDGKTKWRGETYIVNETNGQPITKKHKFVFTEVFNNTNGKTSGSGFIGVMMGLVGCLAFIAAIVGYFMKLPDTIPFMQQTIFFIGSATVLLGVRKFSGKSKEGAEFNVDNTKKD